MNNLSVNNKVSEFLKQDIRLARFFESLGLDACCGGQKTLALACAEKGLDAEKILHQLQSNPESAEMKDNSKPREDWGEASAEELIEHLLTTHHAYTKDALSKLIELMRKTSAAHAGNHPELTQIENTLRELYMDLTAHLMKEEKILFPMIREMENSGGIGDSHCGSPQGPIRVMLMEHERTDALLKTLRDLTGNYTPPADACATYIALFRELDLFEQDLREHIRKENDLLFPKALEMMAES